MSEVLDKILDAFREGEIAVWADILSQCSEELSHIDGSWLQKVISGEETAKAGECASIHLIGAPIRGDIDLSGCHVTIPIRFLDCNVSGALFLVNARLQSLDISRSRFAGIFGQLADFHGDLRAVSTEVKGPTLLKGVHIRGSVNFTRAKLATDGAKLIDDELANRASCRYTDGQFALRLALARVEGDGRFNGTEFGGTFSIDNAEFNGAVTCTEAKIDVLNANHGPFEGARDFAVPFAERIAILATGLRTGDRFILRKAVIQGRIHMRSASIGSHLRLGGCTVVGFRGRSIDLNRAEINGDVTVLSQLMAAGEPADRGGEESAWGEVPETAAGFRSIGAIRAMKCHIRGDLVLIGATLETDGETPQEFSLQAAGLTVDGRVCLQDSNFKAVVDFTVAHFNRTVTVERCRFEPNKRHARRSFLAQHMQVATNVEITDSTFQSTIELEDAHISGTFRFKNNSVLGQGRPAILAERLYVGSNAEFLGEAFANSTRDEQEVDLSRLGVVSGGILLADAQIDGTLLFHGGHYTEVHSDPDPETEPLDGQQQGIAINARGARIARSLIVTGGLRADGCLVLMELAIEDDFVIEFVTLFSSPRGNNANITLRMTRVDIGGSVYMGSRLQHTEQTWVGPSVVSFGRISFSGAEIQEFFFIRSCMIACQEYIGNQYLFSDFDHIALNLTFLRLKKDLFTVQIAASGGAAVPHIGPQDSDVITLHGQLALDDSVIDGNINLNGLKIDACNAGTTSDFCGLSATGLTVASDASFGPNLEVVGSIILSRLKTGGRLCLTHFESKTKILAGPDDVNTDKPGALICQRADIGTNFEISECSFDGCVDFSQLVVGGNLDCTETTFKGTVRPYSLNLQGTVIGRDLILDHRCVFRGHVILIGMTVHDDFEIWLHSFSPIQATHLQANRLSVTGVFYLNRSASEGFKKGARKVNLTDQDLTNQCIVNLQSAQVGVFADDLPWPNPGSLLIDGFRYNRLDPWDPEDLSGERRLCWLHLQPEENIAKLRVQPFVHLARLYRRMGRPDDAKNIDIERFNLERKQTKYLFARMARAMVTKPVNHGFNPERALVFLFFQWMLGTLVFHLAYNQPAGLTDGPAGGERYRCMAPAHEEFYLRFLEPVEVNDSESGSDTTILGDDRQKGSRIDGSDPQGLDRGTQQGEQAHSAEPAGRRLSFESDIRPPADYPQFSALRYSMDTMIPVLDLIQQSYWIPSANTDCFLTLFGEPVKNQDKEYSDANLTGSGTDLDLPQTGWGIHPFRLYHWLHTVAGWYFTTILLFAATGIVRRRADPSPDEIS
ncbi:MAG: hypothetical protein ACFB6R_13680 [Alphaproteobacteria bacterium]